MKQQRIVLLLERLYKLDTQLGGREKLLDSSKKTKEFDYIVQQLKEDMEMITALQQDREKRIKKYGNDDDSIRIGVQIRDNIAAAEKQIIHLQKTLARQIKKNKDKENKEIEERVLQIKLAKVVLKGIKKKEYGTEDEEIEFKQMKELQTDLFQENRMENINNQGPEQLSKEEQDALQRWNLNDQKMDQQLDIIIAGLDQLNLKARLIDEKVDQTGQQIKNITNEVDKANDSLKNQNQALKKLTEVYRRPNKFCLDIMFILLLLGLVASIVMTFTKK
ncbi:hypothetical protein pb186bvf_002932 [Paramecium bursaria]